MRGHDACLATVLEENILVQNITQSLWHKEVKQHQARSINVLTLYSGDCVARHLSLKLIHGAIIYGYTRIERLAICVSRVKRADSGVKIGTLLT